VTQFKDMRGQSIWSASSMVKVAKQWKYWTLPTDFAMLDLDLSARPAHVTVGDLRNLPISRRGAVQLLALAKLSWDFAMLPHRADFVRQTIKTTPGESFMLVIRDGCVVGVTRRPTILSFGDVLHWALETPSHILAGNVDDDGLVVIARPDEMKGKQIAEGWEVVHQFWVAVTGTTPIFSDTLTLWNAKRRVGINLPSGKTLRFHVQYRKDMTPDARYKIMHKGFDELSLPLAYDWARDAIINSPEILVPYASRVWKVIAASVSVEAADKVFELPRRYREHFMRRKDVVVQDRSLQSYTQVSHTCSMVANRIANLSGEVRDVSLIRKLQDVAGRVLHADPRLLGGS